MRFPSQRDPESERQPNRAHADALISEGSNQSEDEGRIDTACVLSTFCP